MCNSCHRNLYTAVIVESCASELPILTKCYLNQLSCGHKTTTQFWILMLGQTLRGLCLPSGTTGMRQLLYSSFIIHAWRRLMSPNEHCQLTVSVFYCMCRYDPIIPAKTCCIAADSSQPPVYFGPNWQDELLIRDPLYADVLIINCSEGSSRSEKTVKTGWDRARRSELICINDDGVGRWEKRQHMLSRAASQMDTLYSQLPVYYL